jgi:hypothetical protein
MAFSPNDQIQPELFAPIKHTDIYISSYKFVLKKLISNRVLQAVSSQICLD